MKRKGTNSSSARIKAGLEDAIAYQRGTRKLMVRDIEAKPPPPMGAKEKTAAGRARPRIPSGPIWYAAHFILVIEHLKRRKRWPRYLVHENVYLVRARTHAEARRKGEALGRAEVIEDDSLRWDGSPARLVYGGIRKTISCHANLRPRKDGLVRVIRDGDEATYSVFVVRDRTSLRQLVAGKPVVVDYQE
jgi:hypothetical protein